MQRLPTFSNVFLRKKRDEKRKESRSNLEILFVTERLSNFHRSSIRTDLLLVYLKFYFIVVFSFENIT